MTHSSGYRFAGSKSAGLINTPSMSAPSLLFHEITSRVPSVKSAACDVMSVSLRGANGCTSVTKSSGSEAGEPAVKATRRPSRVTVNPPPIRSSPPDTRAMAPVAGSSRNRWPAVFCRAEK